MTHIIVPKVHPLKYYGLKLFWIIFGCALIWGAFELGYQQSHKDMIEGKGGRDTLLLKLERLQYENKTLQGEKLQLNRQFQLEKQSAQLLKDSIHTYQESIALLKKELAFYKAMLAPAEDKDSIFVQRLDINSSADKQRYEYKLIIAQKVKKRNFATGTVKLLIKGTQSSKPVTLTLDSLTEGKDKLLQYRFKYFQTFKGHFSLPESMEPTTISVIINSKTPKQKVEYNDLPWSENGGIIDVGQ
jgi:hypothetical protein